MAHTSVGIGNTDTAAARVKKLYNGYLNCVKEMREMRLCGKQRNAGGEKYPTALAM